MRKKDKINENDHGNDYHEWAMKTTENKERKYQRFPDYEWINANS